MDNQNQLTANECKKLLHILIFLQLGSRTSDMLGIKAKLKRQLAEHEKCEK